MNLTIDNLDGLGAINYTKAIWSEGRLEIARSFNSPSRCTWQLVLTGTTLALPQRRGRVVVTSAAGLPLFTGYVATAPEKVVAGGWLGNVLYRVAVSALSDDWLLDRQELAGAVNGFSQPAASVLQTLTSRTGTGAVATSGAVTSRNIGVFTPNPIESWSKNAARLASASYAGYRVVNLALSLLSVGATTHSFSDQDGSLSPGLVQAGQVKELANDITVSGEMEPTTYVTELFLGDGSTTVLKLSAEPFHPSRLSGGGVLLNDTFGEAELDAELWNTDDPGGALSLTGRGLTLNGGDGQDGGTTLTAVAPLELAGTILFEMGGVQLSGACNGVLGGLYSGPVSRQSCVAGFDVRQVNGTTVATPLVSGADVGTGLTLLSGHTYTLRMRLHCREAQRVNQIYYTMVEGAVQAFGGGLITAPTDVVFEYQDLGAASNTPATVLYDGSLTTTPAVCSFALINSEQLFGSVNYCRITRRGPVWVTSTPPSAAKRTRLIGVAGEGVDCTLSTEGTMTFLSGRIPVAGEAIAVTYRLSDRSIARLADPQSIATEAAAGFPGTAQWMGKISHPVARSSGDCLSAAAGLLSLSTSADAALSGRYLMTNPNTDIWPGDVLAFTQTGSVTNVLTRKATIKDAGSVPEVLTYSLEFANDWAEALGIDVVEGVASDAMLPESASTVSSKAVVPNLSQLQVLTASGSAIQLDAGMAPLTGGGFEVRRRDGGFAGNSDQDLVLRSPVRAFTIPRTAQVEHFYIRAYDGSSTPLYSAVSSAVFTNFPVS